jgi:NADPH-dependent 2,4-dienoyl-CoA reductase/sulfur reductase-like enzyme
MDPKATKVVVVGGGYAGVMAANRLTQRNDVDVTLISPRPRFVHRMRLHQLVGGSDDAVVDYCEILADRIRLVVGTVTDIRPAERRVSLAAGDSIAYDYLIYAVGSRPAEPRVPSAAEFAYKVAGLGAPTHRGPGPCAHRHRPLLPVPQPGWRGRHRAARLQAGRREHVRHRRPPRIEDQGLELHGSHRRARSRRTSARLVRLARQQPQAPTTGTGQPKPFPTSACCRTPRAGLPLAPPR